MRALADDEKLKMVMAYTPNMLARGEMIANEGVRLSIWLRTQGVSNFVHLIKPQAILFGNGAPRTLTYSELYVPTKDVIAFHLAPPLADPMDYDANEANRAMEPITALVGTFMIKAKIRISTQTDLGTSLDVMHMKWLSLYDAEICNPNLPQFNLRVPMLLVNSETVTFGV